MMASSSSLKEANNVFKIIKKKKKVKYSYCMMASSSSLKEANNVFKIIKKKKKLNILYDGLLQFTKRGQ